MKEYLLAVHFVLFNLKERINRGEYWAGLTIIGYTPILIALINLVTVAPLGRFFSEGLILVSILAIPIITKRLHDLNLSGMWTLLLPITGPIAIILLGCWPGNPDSNKYGEPPP